MDHRDEAEKAWDKKYEMLHLDKELYYNKGNITTFIIVTQEELKEIKRKTAERMREWGDWSEEDFKKLEVV